MATTPGASLPPPRGPAALHTPVLQRGPQLHAHNQLHTYLNHLLRHNVPASDVNNYSFHSLRIGFASALLAAGCPYDMIQALARWRSAESVKIYARLNPSDYTGWVCKALAQQTTSRTTARLPVIDAHNVIATFGAAGRLFQATATTEE